MINDASVSRVHASIRMTSEGPIIKDLGSKFGTLIRGKAMHNIRYPIAVQIGRVMLRFKLQKGFFSRLCHRCNKKGTIFCLDGGASQTEESEEIVELSLPHPEHFDNIDANLHTLSH